MGLATVASLTCIAQPALDATVAAAVLKPAVGCQHRAQAAYYCQPCVVPLWLVPLLCTPSGQGAKRRISAQTLQHSVNLGTAKTAYTALYTSRVPPSVAGSQLQNNCSKGMLLWELGMLYNNP